MSTPLDDLSSDFDSIVTSHKKKSDRRDYLSAHPSVDTRPEGSNEDRVLAASELAFEAGYLRAIKIVREWYKAEGYQV